MTSLLDTNICIYLIKQKPKSVLDRFAQHTPGDVGVSSITVAELMYGIAKSSRPMQNRAALAFFLQPLQHMPFSAEAAEMYGKIRATLERNGTPIGPLDTLIAAHALSLDVTLVTNNEREFKRIQGLRIENWAT